ncbi:T9SS type A sorting domain-containing protein [Hymenobacter sp. BT523]|uniref:T9SS type A sorting domain-containing protein n=1 Tax=Hymenobacter sp. BT523 TaxID=2795725 RepID=UPI0018EBADA8|nr:T9SS type A sorting domain-containing protein [Hymenobacter sp. BT523]MBJ6108046.1 T9SS type A sorting domain-containing protein [Hymenobacter sp. BT523]
MKPLRTLLAMGALTAASLTASAQFTVDGVASATEIGTGVGKYQLAGSYTGTHLDPDRGLKALYVGYTATTLNLMLVGSGESSTAGAYRSFILYFNTPARPGVPAGTQLPGGLDTGSPLAHRPTLDLQVDYGIRAVVGPSASDVYFSAVSYVTGTGTSPVGTDPYVGQGNKSGTVVTATTAVLTGTRFAYTNTVSLAANTTNTGVEVEIPLSALNNGSTTVGAGSRLDLFAAFTDSNGNFITADVIPQVAGRTTAFGSNPDFTAIAGTQAVAFALGTGVLANRNAVASGLDFQVYPNPASAASSTVAYTVPAGRQPVSLAVYNALGQRVRSLAAAEQSGAQQFPLGSLPAGAYLVKLQVGDQLTSRKVVVQ